MDKEIKRIRLLKLWEILSRDTDEEHPISTNEILAKLAKEGIECFRITLYDDIKTLQKYGYEIFCVRSTSNKYYVSDRSLSVPEVKVIMDAVQAASFISERKTGELVDKVAKLAGTKKGEVLMENIVEFTIAKTENEDVLSSVNEISQAIINRKKIYFNYFDLDESFNRVYRMKKSDPEKKRGYKVNPLGTIFDSGYYYLFCYDDFFKSVSHYRIDRMSEVTMIEDDITEGITAEAFDLPTRKRQLFSMFGGVETTIDIQASKELIDVIYDKFGDLVKLSVVDNQTVGFTVDVQVSPTFIAWCCSFGNKLKVVSPKAVVEQIKNYVNEVVKNYEES